MKRENKKEREAMDPILYNKDMTLKPTQKMIRKNKKTKTSRSRRRY